jgi:hypothetical protein
MCSQKVKKFFKEEECEEDKPKKVKTCILCGVESNDIAFHICKFCDFLGKRGKIIGPNEDIAGFPVGKEKKGTCVCCGNKLHSTVKNRCMCFGCYICPLGGGKSFQVPREVYGYRVADGKYIIRSKRLSYV